MTNRFKYALVLLLLVPLCVQAQDNDYYDRALAGRTAGVDVTLPDGMPGRSAGITVHGAGSALLPSSPLFVIDGFICTESMANMLSPVQIDSVTVLKDAAALALYGARGANGVVVVKTRKGGGSGINVGADMHWGMSYPSRSASVLDGSYFTDKITESALLQSYDVYVSGCSNNAGNSFRLDLSMLDNGGILKNTDFGRYNARFFFSQKINKRLGFYFGGFYAVSVRGGLDPTRSLMPGDSHMGYLMYDVWACNGQDAPVAPGTDRTADWRFNPVTALDNYYGKVRSSEFNGSLGFNLDIIEGLKATASLAYDIRNRHNMEFFNSSTPSGSPGSASGTGISASDLTSGTDKLQAGLGLCWKPAFLPDAHSLTMRAGAFYENESGSHGGQSAINMTTEALGLHGMNMGTYVPVDHLSWKWSILSFNFDASYVFDHRYEISASIRTDGIGGELHESQSFRRSFNLYPGVSASWHFGQENFAEGLPWLDDAALKVSWAGVGNTAFNTPYADLIAQERSSQSDIGLSASFWKGRLMMDAGYYKRKTADALVPDAGTFSGIGEVLNSGVDISLRAAAVRDNDLSVDLYANIGFNKNEMPDVNEYSAIFKAAPGMFGGFGASMKSGRIDAAADFCFRSGCEVLNLARLYLKPTPSTDYSEAVENGSFLRLRRLSAGYTLPESFLRRYHVSLARVFLSLDNLFVISGYSGYDPEVSVERYATPGIDWSSYPRAGSVSVGLNINF